MEELNPLEVIKRVHLLLSAVDAVFLLFNMALTKEKKQKTVEALEQKIDDQKIMIFAGFKNIKNKDLLGLRKDLKLKSSGLMVAKKTLANLAFKKKKLEIDTDVFEGETAIVFGFEDEITPAKTTFDFSKNNPSFKILGGFLEGKFRSSADITELAKLPSREEILGRFVGAINSPVSSFVGVLNGNIKGLITVLSKIKA